AHAFYSPEIQASTAFGPFFLRHQKKPTIDKRLEQRGTVLHRSGISTSPYPQVPHITRLRYSFPVDSFT
ncbi:MAG: hypothetical protein WCX88_02900, partial [Patescibacteria group bacterium]